ncbi:MAG: fatty acid desaturase family protein [Bdellovibrionota bacterium]
MFKKQSPLLIHRADRLTLFVVAIHFAVMVFCLAHFRAMGAMQCAIACALLCLTSFLVSVIVHNTVHVPVFRSRLLNKCFQVVLSVGQGHPVTAFVPGHNFSHHMHLQTNKDIMRSTQVRFRWNFLNQLLFFFFVIPEIMDSERRWGRKMRVENPAFYRQSQIEMIAVYGLKIFVTVLNWKAALLLVWIPHLYGNWGIVGTNVWQHDGCVEGDRYDHSRSATGKLLNAFVFNNGFHAAHHLNAGIHWSQLPAYHEEHVAPFAHPSLQQKSLIQYLWRASFQPGKRVDLLGSAIPVPMKTKSEDWIAGVDLRSSEYTRVLGADPFELGDADLVEA